MTSNDAATPPCEIEQRGLSGSETIGVTRVPDCVYGSDGQAEGTRNETSYEMKKTEEIEKKKEKRQREREREKGRGERERARDESAMT